MAHCLSCHPGQSQLKAEPRNNRELTRLDPDSCSMPPGEDTHSPWPSWLLPPLGRDSWEGTCGPDLSGYHLALHLFLACRIISLWVTNASSVYTSDFHKIRSGPCFEPMLYDFRAHTLKCTLIPITAAEMGLFPPLFKVSSTMA